MIGVKAPDTMGADIDYCGLGVAVWLGSGDVSAWLSPLLARRSARLARCCSAALFLSEAIGVDEAMGRDVATFEGERVAAAAGSWAAAVGEISGRLGFLPRCSCIFCWRSAWTCACSCRFCFSSCAARAVFRRFWAACFGEMTFSAGLGCVGSAAVSGATGGCSPLGRGEIVEAEFGRKVAAGVGNAGAGGGLLGKGAGVPTGIALAVETVGFTA